jgi:lipid-A-disaccharide synthase
MRYFLIAGEASGDLLASQLMRGILNNDPSAEFEYWGGDAMAEIAPGLKQHYKDIAIMGFLEVLLKIREIKGNINRCKSHILNF